MLSMTCSNFWKVISEFEMSRKHQRETRSFIPKASPKLRVI